jgi:tetratricopeptide (TPR) repeat protein
MGLRKLALAVGLAASCAGCVTETKTVPVSPETLAKMPGIKEAEAPKREPQANTWLALGQLHETRAGDPQKAPFEQAESRDEARKAYQKAIELNPKNSDAYVCLANLYLKQEDAERALTVYQRGLQLNPNAAALWYEQGLVHCRRKDLGAGLKCLAKAHELEPDNRKLALDYGLCLARAGNAQQAVVVLSKVMSPADANYNVARMMLHNGQSDLARQYAQVAIAARPAHPGATQLMAALDRPARLQGPSFADGGATQGAAQPVQQTGYRP